MNLRIKNTNLTIQIIGWLQIVGGITGIGLMAYLMVHTGVINGSLLLVLLIGLGLFIFSIIAGNILIKNKAKPTGIILSIINQIIQIFQWSIGGFGLTYSSGAGIVIGVENGILNFNLAFITSKFNMVLNNGNDLNININLFAVLVLIILIDIFNELNIQNKIKSSEPT